MGKFPGNPPFAPPKTRNLKFVIDFDTLAFTELQMDPSSRGPKRALRRTREEELDTNSMSTQADDDDTSASQLDHSDSVQSSKTDDAASQPDSDNSSDALMDQHVQSPLDLKFLSAAEEGDISNVKKLLDEGADLYTKNSQGDNALHLAVYYSNREVVDFLLERYPNLVETRGAADWTPLQNSVMSVSDEEDNDHIFNKILSKSGGKVLANQAEKGDTALIQAIRREKIPRALAILKTLEGKKTAGTAGEEKQTALHVACRDGHTELARILLKMGLPLDTKDDEGRTALHCKWH